MTSLRAHLIGVLLLAVVPTALHARLLYFENLTGRFGVIVAGPYVEVAYP